MASTQPVLSSAGIGSGLDVNAIVQKLIAVESRPLSLLKSQASELNAKLSSFGKLQGNFAAMRDKSNALLGNALWQGTKSTSSDTASVKVAAEPNAVAGKLDVEVSKLATGQSVVSPALPGSGATLSEGQITLELGKWIDTPAPAFDPRISPPAVTITIGQGETTLGAVRDKINAAGAGVVATVINDASGARLMLRSADTGEESAFRITVNETVDDGNAGTGLSMLAYDAHASSVMTRNQAAANAEFKVNGVDVSSASNTVTDIIDGVSLTLVKPTTAPVQVDVASDTEAIKKAITDFVDTFNATATYLRAQTAYNESTKVAGELQGDSGALAIQSQLRAVINTGSTASATYGRLSDVGIAMKTDGTLEINQAKLDKALTNLPELRKVIEADGATQADSGFVRRFKRLADAALGSDGVFDSRTQGLKSSVQRNTKAQDAMQQRLDLTEARLRKQYQSLDTTMSRMTALSTYVGQQMSMLSNG